MFVAGPTRYIFKMLELRGVSKRYGDVQALRDLSFSVPEGSLVGFVGPNGAGKTTAMRIVMGLLAADGGEVRWRGRPLDRAVRRTFGYMPEERGLYPKMRVAEQLVYLARLRGCDRQRVEESAGRWLERLGISERAADPVESLSLGNQQRVQLAAALVHEPRLLVLDEPFSGLDPVAVDVLAEALRSEARTRGIPVVFSSHQLELVERLCDAVAIVSGGTLVADGDVEALRRSHGGRRYRVEVDAPDDAWRRTVPGARWHDGVVELPEDADPQRLLEAAVAAGRVLRFGREEPTLAEVFREAIAPREQVTTTADSS
jgi:ABC-2 type transport system ATP-binding protein